MTIGTATITAGVPEGRGSLALSDEIAPQRDTLLYEATVGEAGPSTLPRAPLARRLLSTFAAGLSVSAVSAVAFGIAGSDDGVFISLLSAGGFASLTATAALRYFSNGRI